MISKDYIKIGLRKDGILNLLPWKMYILSEYDLPALVSYIQLTPKVCITDNILDNIFQSYNNFHCFNQCCGSDPFFLPDLDQRIRF